MKSTSGYIYLVAGGAISWKSVKQSIVASSIMAVKFVACYEASNHGIWLRNFVMGLRILDGIERPLKLFCDNKSAVLYQQQQKLYKVKIYRHQIPSCQIRGSEWTYIYIAHWDKLHDCRSTD